MLSRARWEKLYREGICGSGGGFFIHFIRTILLPASILYGWVMILRALCYRQGILRSHSLPKPVISVGNITAGGTGKTPMVSLLARMLMARGLRVAVLSRGYGGTLSKTGRIVSDGSIVSASPDEAGDEPYLLAKNNPGLIVAVGADRYRMGLMVHEKHKPDLFLLDDGFQHLRLKRDLDILLLDCRYPWGNGRCLPAGPLREPKSAAVRAHLALFTRCSEKTPVLPEALPLPFCTSRHILAGYMPLQWGETKPLPQLSALKGFAFAGIAAPESFFTSLEQSGLVLAGTHAFGDHAKYGHDEVELILGLKESVGADYIITTQKDAVKLEQYVERLQNAYFTVLELNITDSAPLGAALDKLLSMGSRFVVSKG